MYLIDREVAFAYHIERWVTFVYRIDIEVFLYII